MRTLWIFLCGVILSLSACAATPEGGHVMNGISLTSPAYQDGAMIPVEFTADGKDIHPPYRISALPDGTRSLALIMDDPDAPMGTWVHWVVWNLPAEEGELPAGQLPDGAVEGTNSWGRPGYGGPSPPSGTHRYFLRLFALDCRLDLPSSTDAEGLRRAIEGHVLATARLMGRYSR